MNTNTQKAILKRTIDVRKTLLAIPIAESVVVRTKDIKPNQMRAAVSRLNNEKDTDYLFETSERGLIDQIKVTRIK